MSGVDAIDKESNRLAQSAAEDTPKPKKKPAQEDVTKARQRQLSSLFDEDMPDLLAASCLSRRTIERVAKSEYEPAPDTLAALEMAMRLLDPANRESIAGWREVVTIEGLAGLLDTTCQDAQDRVRGRTTWTVSDRKRLVDYLMELRGEGETTDGQISSVHLCTCWHLSRKPHAWHP